MANIVECPMCDSKFDVSKLAEGTKLKCSKCKKVIGKLSGGELVPILETVKKPTAPPPPRPAQPVAPYPQQGYYEGEQGDEYEEVVVRRRVPHAPPPPEGYAPARQSYRERMVAREEDKPEFLLAVAGLVGMGAVATLIYVFVVISQPVMRPPVVKVQPAKTSAAASTIPSGPSQPAAPAESDKKGQ